MSAAAAVPTVLAPPNNGTNQPAMLTLKVGKTADASRYQWQVSTLPTFTTFFTNDSTADTTYTGQFTGGQTFYLRVRGMNDLGASAFSAVDTFTVMTPPARTTLVLPANNAVNVISDSVFFVWRLVSGAASYNLQVSTVNSTNTYATTDTTYRSMASQSSPTTPGRLRPSTQVGRATTPAPMRSRPSLLLPPCLGSFCPQALRQMSIG